MGGERIVRLLELRSSDILLPIGDLVVAPRSSSIDIVGTISKDFKRRSGLAARFWIGVTSQALQLILRARHRLRTRQRGPELPPRVSGPYLAFSSTYDVICSAVR